VTQWPNEHELKEHPVYEPLLLRPTDSALVLIEECGTPNSEGTARIFTRVYGRLARVKQLGHPEAVVVLRTYE